MSARTYRFDWHCDHCNAETPHECYSAGHERDSSRDWRRCQQCGWKYHSMTGEYEPPDEPWTPSEEDSSDGAV